jgi:hypothetical protein
VRTHFKKTRCDISGNQTFEDINKICLECTDRIEVSGQGSGNSSRQKGNAFKCYLTEAKFSFSPLVK